MSKEHTDMDNLFKENLSGFELPEKKANWELMNSLLDQQEKKKKNKRLIIFFFSFFLMLSTGYLLLNFSNEKSEEKHTTVVNPGSDNTPSPISNSVKKKNTNSPVSVQSNKIEKKKFAETESQEIKDKNIFSVSREKSKHFTMKNNKINYSGVANNENGNHSAITQEEINFPFQAQASVTDTPDSAISLSNKTNEKDSVMVNPINQETAIPNALINNSPQSKSVHKDSVNTIANNNSASVDSAASKQIIPVKGKLWNVNFYVGANFYSTSNISSSNQNISPVAGLEFKHTISPHIAIGLSGLYSLQGGYHLNDTVRQEAYFLDKNVSQQTIHIHQLHKLYFPLTLYYAISERHAVTGSFQITYLLNTNGNYTETHHSSSGDSQSEKNNVKGYMDGIKTINTSVLVGYKYLLSKKFDLNALITRELTDSYTKDYFSGVKTKPSWSFQTFLIVKF